MICNTCNQSNGINASNTWNLNCKNHKYSSFFWNKFPRVSRDIKSLVAPIAPAWWIPERLLYRFEARWTVILENSPKHCFARLTKYQRAIEPLAAVIVWHITSKIFSLFDKCKIDGSNKYDKVGERPNKLKIQLKRLDSRVGFEGWIWGLDLRID